jgi:formylglycine-generating enzyme required for sulfatase activity
MKRAVCLILGVMLVGAAAFAGTIANVISSRDRLLTIDKGQLDGVQVGMKGTVKAVYKDPSGEYDMNIGLFTVRRTEAHRAEIYIESIGAGLNPEDARFVVFDLTLTPSSEPPPPRTETKTAAPSVDALLETGDRAMAAGNYAKALESFTQALKQEPENLIASEKAADAQSKITENEIRTKFKKTLKDADNCAAQADVKYAFLHLVEALKAYPAGEGEVRQRLQALAKAHGPELRQIMNEKAGSLNGMLPQLTRMLGVAQESGPKAPLAAAAIDFRNPDAARESIRRQALSVYQNNSGFWEAEFADKLLLVEIPEGPFTVGSPEGQGDADEHPAHRTVISTYWIGKTEVTFEQYDRFCRETNRPLPADEGWGWGRHPVINVSWEDADGFCRWLNAKTGLPFRLPSEAEWEKAAHGLYPWGRARPDSSLANFDGQLRRTATVGVCPAGASRYGVYDLAGNVWEWVLDWYAADAYGRSPAVDPKGPAMGKERVVRGGSWRDGPTLIRSANRSSAIPPSQVNILGFRVAIGGS